MALDEDETVKRFGFDDHTVLQLIHSPEKMRLIRNLFGVFGAMKWWWWLFLYILSMAQLLVHHCGSENALPLYFTGGGSVMKRSTPPGSTPERPVWSVCSLLSTCACNYCGTSHGECWGTSGRCPQTCFSVLYSLNHVIPVTLRKVSSGILFLMLPLVPILISHVIPGLLLCFSHSQSYGR